MRASHLFASLIAFNVGLEAGLVLLVLLLVPVLQLLFRFGIAERLGTIILSVLVGHTAWHWTWDRYDQLVQYQFVWPVVDAAFLAVVVRWLMVLVVLVGAGWVIRGLGRSGGTGRGGTKVAVRNRVRLAHHVALRAGARPEVT